jgi:hypothetical protein
MTRCLLALAFVLSATVTAQEHEHTPECKGFVIAAGIVSQADHEAAEGFANIGNDFGLSMRPSSPFYQRVLELRGKPVEVVLRPLPERTLERIK